MRKIPCFCNAHAQVMGAENSITLTIYTMYQCKRIYSTGMALSDYGFSWYTYQDPEYIIRAMNTKHAQCTCYTHSAGNQTLYIWVFLLQAARMIALCCSEHICDQVA